MSRPIQAIERDIIALADAIAQAGAAKASKTIDTPGTDPGTKAMAKAVVEDLSGVSVEWLGAAVPVVEKLISMGKDEALSDADFIAAAEAMAREMPSLFDKLNWQALAGSLEAVMGSAMINGAVQRQLEFERAQRQ